MLGAATEAERAAAPRPASTATRTDFVGGQLQLDAQRAGIDAKPRQRLLEDRSGYPPPARA